MDTFGEGGRLKLAAGRDRFFQLGQNIKMVGRPKRSSMKSDALICFTRSRLPMSSAAVAFVAPAFFGDDGIGFGGRHSLNGSLPPLIRKEACCLLEGFFAQPRYFQQFFAAVERAVFIAVGDDVLGKGLIQTGNPH